MEPKERNEDVEDNYNEEDDSGHTATNPKYGTKHVKVSFIPSITVGVDLGKISEESKRNLRQTFNTINRSAKELANDPNFRSDVKEKLGPWYDRQLDGLINILDKNLMTEEGQPDTLPDPDSNELKLHANGQTVYVQFPAMAKLKNAIDRLQTISIDYTTGVAPSYSVNSSFRILLKGIDASDIGRPFKVTTTQWIHSRINDPVTKEKKVSNVKVENKQIPIAGPANPGVGGNVEHIWPANGEVECSYIPVGNYGKVYVQASYIDSQGRYHVDAKAPSVSGIFEEEARHLEKLRYDSENVLIEMWDTMATSIQAVLAIMNSILDMLAAMLSNLGAALDIFGIPANLAATALETAENILSIASAAISAYWGALKLQYRGNNDLLHSMNLRLANDLPESGAPVFPEVLH